MPALPTFPMLLGGRLRRAEAGRGRPVHDAGGTLVGHATTAMPTSLMRWLLHALRCRAGPAPRPTSADGCSTTSRSCSTRASTGSPWQAPTRRTRAPPPTAGSGTPGGPTRSTACSARRTPSPARTRAGPRRGRSASSGCSRRRRCSGWSTRWPRCSPPAPPPSWSRCPASLAGLAELLAAGELPAGAANLLAGEVAELAPALADAGVDGLDPGETLFEATPDLRVPGPGHTGVARLRAWNAVTTVWHPVGADPAGGAAS